MSRRSNDTFASTSMIENLEGRQLMAATPQIIGIKIANVPNADGKTTSNSNRITIGFDKAVRLKDTSLFTSFGYANSLTNASKQVKRRVGLTITQTESNVLTIITDRLIRKGSKLTILSGGLTDTKNNALAFDGSSSAKTITFTKGQNKPRYSLSNRNFVATNLAYFDPAVFTGAPTPTTASSTPSATTIRGNLSTFMNAKVSAGVITAAQATQALTIYDSDAAVGIIPNANLRAALASLVGTAAEPAINSYISGTNVTGKAYSIVNFGTTSSSAPVGETKLSSKGRLYLTVNSSYAGEPFQVLSATLAHEALHQDSATTSSAGDLPSSQDEEIVANAVETIVYGQQLLIDPSVAGNASKLVVRTNTRLLALLNSGQTLFPYGGIFQEPGLNNNGNVFVGAKTDPGSFGDNSTVKSFENWIRREYVSRGFSSGGTSTSAVARSILSNIVGSGKNLTLFGSTTEGFLDNSNKVLTDVAYIKLAQAIKLNYGA